jgi:hypothetical protein
MRIWLGNCNECDCVRKGLHIVRSFQLPAVPLVVAVAVLAGSLGAGAVSPATAVRPPAAPVISVSGNGRTAVALRTALSHVRRTGDRQFALVSAGLSSQARSADSALVAGLNKVGREAGAPSLASGSAADVADAVLTADQGTTVVQVVPGTTLTISGTKVVLDVSAQDVTDIENAAGLGSAIASLVGSILGVIPDPGLGGASAIAGIVANSLTIGSDVLKLCAGNDGGAVILSISAPSGQLPSVSACGISV